MNPINQLVEAARNNIDFFHDLVFHPEKVLKDLSNLDRNEKGAIISQSPEIFINKIFQGWGAGCGGNTTCCCTSGTCSGVTCGGSTCSVTCSGASCGNTCGDSCGNTSNLQNRFNFIIRSF